MGTIRCLMCGVAILPDAQSYERHIEQRHSLDGYRIKIKPVRTTDRTKAQIVQDMEKGVLAPFIIERDGQPNVELEHTRPVPPSYCGPGGNVCVWEDNGWEICGPCAYRKSVCGERVTQ